MAEVKAIYREVVLDHYRHPRNFAPVDHFPRQAAAVNPLCGDEIRVGVTVENERVTAMQFHGRGCAVCMAAASLLSEHMPGMHRQHASEYAAALCAALQAHGEDELPSPLEPLTALRAYPTRHRCVTLAAEALEQAASPT